MTPALSDVDFIIEATELDALGRELARRRDVSPAEILNYRRRRADLLSACAERSRNPDDQRLADMARAAVDELLAGVD